MPECPCAAAVTSRSVSITPRIALHGRWAPLGLPEQKYRGLGRIKQQKVILHGFEGGVLGSRCQHIRHPMREGWREAGLLSLLVKALIASRGLHPDDPISSRSHSLQIPSHWALGFGRDANIQSIVLFMVQLENTPAWYHPSSRGHRGL